MRRQSIASTFAVAIFAVVAYGTTASGAVTGAKQGSGVRGRITAGPTCPVERVGHPCPPRPVTAGIRAQRGGGQVVARTRSDGNGNYAMTLRPGRYTLVVETGSSFPHCPQTNITVPRHGFVTADIRCDTGIR
jgi:hypothetical protein